MIELRSIPDLFLDEEETMKDSQISTLWMENLVKGQDVDRARIFTAMRLARLHGNADVIVRSGEDYGFLKTDLEPAKFAAELDEVLVRLGLVRFSCWVNTELDVEGAVEVLADEPAAHPEESWMSYVSQTTYVSYSLTADTGAVTIAWSTSDLACADAIRAFMKKNMVDRPSNGTVYMLGVSQSGLTFQPVGKGGSAPVLENYVAAVREAYGRISEELVAENPRGRLTVVNGPPGTGKTYLIRGLIHSIHQAVFVVVPQHLVLQLLAADGITALSNFRQSLSDEPIVLILEDADDMLAPRQQGDTSAISGLLNIGDGIIGSALDLRILATTNREHQEFDDAILRPGRLSTHITVGHLDPQTATEVYRRLTGKEKAFSKAISLATVYQMAYDEGWTGVEQTKKKVGFGV